MSGLTIYFDSSGRVVKELNFYDDALNGKSYFYSKSGMCIAIYSYIYDKKYEELLYMIDPESPPRDHIYSPYSADDFY